jgi:LCP family protein required for cell wall assembly
LAGPRTSPLREPARATPPRREASEEAPSPGIRRYALVGVDRRADGKGPALADTILVLVVDEENERAGVLSVPRDLYVEVPGRGPDRINTVLTQARRAGVDPIGLLGEVLAGTFGWQVDQGVIVDLGVFERAVDAVGGVSIVAPCAVRDRFLDSRAPGGRRLLDIAPGPRRLDGATASMYVRSRRGGADWTRARRQQAVLLALRSRLSGTGLARLPALWTELEASITTNMRRIDLLRLARTLVSLPPKGLHGVVIGRRETEDYRTPEGRLVLVARSDALHRAVDGLFDAPPPGTRPEKARCPRMPPREGVAESPAPSGSDDSPADPKPI